VGLDPFTALLAQKELAGRGQILFAWTRRGLGFSDQNQPKNRSGLR
jgi:hypothetical protein